jgi:hypothetical protein
MDPFMGASSRRAGSSKSNYLIDIVNQFHEDVSCELPDLYKMYGDLFGEADCYPCGHLCEKNEVTHSYTADASTRHQQATSYQLEQSNVKFGTKVSSFYKTIFFSS